MLDGLKFWKRKGAKSGAGAWDKSGDEEITLRRWESAATNRLNSAHWQNVNEQSINKDLGDWQTTLRSRAYFEMAQNPMLTGVVETYAASIAGPRGPNLQVHSDNPKYNEWREEIWRDWFAMPDIAGRITGVEMLKLWARTFWPCGEYLAQEVNGKGDKGSQIVEMRVKNIHPRRLRTPLGPETMIAPLGIEINKETGAPVAYHIAEETTISGSIVGSVTTERIRAKVIIHEFKQTEADQLRGVPWIACNLQTAADLRDYDNQVLDAARAAADNGYLLETQPGVEFEPIAIEAGATREIERRSGTVVPPGYHAIQMVPQQPSSNYVAHRDELLRHYGRPALMPLMMVKLDSMKHSYAGARMDRQMFDDGIAGDQHSLFETTLNRLETIVEREAWLAVGRNLFKEGRPEKITRTWGWYRPAHVDPSKESKSDETETGIATSSIGDSLSRKGNRDIETHIKILAREKALFESIGIPYPVGRPKAAAPAAKSEPEDDDEKEEEDDDAQDNPK